MRTLEELNDEINKLEQERKKLMDKKSKNCKNNDLYRQLKKINKTLLNTNITIKIPINLQWNQNEVCEANIPNYHNSNYLYTYDEIYNINEMIADNIFDTTYLLSIVGIDSPEYKKLLQIQEFEKLQEEYRSQYGFYAKV